MKTPRLLLASSALMVVATGVSLAQQLTVDLHAISDSGVGDKIGTISISEDKGGVQLRVAAKAIPKGQHGFHLHQNGDCGPGMKDGKTKAGIAAGGHYDPEQTHSHKGPEGMGHKGDLPALNATDAGVDQVVSSARLKLGEMRGRALVVHKGGDTYSDSPKDGGGEDRIACALVPK
jgi:Cu-Zn family superoxide dismutase